MASIDQAENNPSPDGLGTRVCFLCFLVLCKRRLDQQSHSLTHSLSLFLSLSLSLYLFFGKVRGCTGGCGGVGDF